MVEPLHPRRDYQQSCHELQRLGLAALGAVPPLPSKRPNFDDANPLGVHFFRTRLAVVDLSNMTLTRTFFGRSEIASVTFCNTDLSESTLCWNDFIRVDFSDGSLADSDLRASIFNGVDFSRCKLRNCDLRRSTFSDCDFTDADLLRAKLTRRQSQQLRLTVAQKEVVDWQDDDGEEPGGG